jgi:nucleoside-diphosphate-sugar epimerase
MTGQIAILGASSRIAKDLIGSFAAEGRDGLLLYVRDVAAMSDWLRLQDFVGVGSVHPYERYGSQSHDAVLNFVGVGDPKRAAAMGTAILELTQRFDDLVLAQLERHPERRYVFMSSGAAYGNVFAEPATRATQARLPINGLGAHDFYAAAKLHAEVRHRARPRNAIVDLRVFNYFSRHQDIDARFFITDIARAIRDRSVLSTSADSMVRDYLHPSDLHRLVAAILKAPAANAAVDCYSKAPVDKRALLQAMTDRFGLHFEITSPDKAGIPNATGEKAHYYSLNRAAEEFGYVPEWSSLEGIAIEMAALLG